MSSRSNEYDIHLQSDDLDWNLQLFEHDVHSGNYILKTGTANGIQTQMRKPANTSLIGYLKSGRGGQARIVIADQYLAGMIEYAGVRFFIEPAFALDPSLPKDYLIIYSIDAIIQNNNIQCGYDLYTQHSKQLIQQQKTKTNNSRGNCLLTEIAISNDYTMFQKWGTEAAVENWNTTILTLMLVDFDNEFQQSIEFVQTASFVATSSAGDPWDGINSIFDQLDAHQAWGNSGGYGAYFDVAVNWTNKFKTGTIGLAWGLSFLCTSDSYIVCSDFGAGNNCLRQLQSHEVGHIFGAFHDSGGSPYIMAAGVNCSNEWSSVSLTTINNELKSYTCLDPCNGSEPECNFYGIPTENCISFNVKFYDLSTNKPTSWQWSFPGGTPSSSTIQNPTVQYKSYGTYDVTLKVSNASGSNTATFKEYIFANTKPVAGFAKTIKNRTVSFSNTSTYSDNYDWDFGDGQTSNEKDPTHIYLDDGIYTVTLKATNNCGFNEMKIKITIVTETLASFTSDTTSGCTILKVKYFNKSSKNSNSFEWEFPGGTPATSTLIEPIVEYHTPGIFNAKLIAKNSLYQSTLEKPNYISVLPFPISDFSFDSTSNSDEISFNNTSKYVSSSNWNFGDQITSTEYSPIHKYNAEGNYKVTLVSMNSCGNDTSSKTVNVHYLPKVDFSADTETICVYGNVQFISKTSPDVNTWFWLFDGGSPDSSTERNPLVFYNKKGTFSVKLKVQNSKGDNEIIKDSYIQVLSTVLCPDFKNDKTDLIFNTGFDPLKQPINKDIFIYPNPFNGHLNILGNSNSSCIQIRLINLSGVEVYHKSVEISQNQYIEELKLDYLHEGPYLLEIQSTTDRYTKMVFIYN